ALIALAILAPSLYAIMPTLNGTDVALTPARLSAVMTRNLLCVRKELNEALRIARRSFAGFPGGSPASGPVRLRLGLLEAHEVGFELIQFFLQHDHLLVVKPVPCFKSLLHLE